MSKELPYLCVCVSMYVCMYVYMYVCMYVCMYVGVESLHGAAMRSITTNWGTVSGKVNHLPRSLQEDIAQYQKSKEGRRKLEQLSHIN